MSKKRLNSREEIKNVEEMTVSGNPPIRPISIKGWRVVVERPVQPVSLVLEVLRLTEAWGRISLIDEKIAVSLAKELPSIIITPVDG